MRFLSGRSGEHLIAVRLAPPAHDPAAGLGPSRFGQDRDERLVDAEVADDLEVLRNAIAAPPRRARRRRSSESGGRRGRPRAGPRARRPAALSRRRSAGGSLARVRPLSGMATPDGLLRQPRLLDRLLRHGGVPFFTMRSATRPSMTVSQEQHREHDQEREPPVDDECERGRGRRQREAHREEQRRPPARSPAPPRFRARRLLALSSTAASSFSQLADEPACPTPRRIEARIPRGSLAVRAHARQLNRFAPSGNRRYDGPERPLSSVGRAPPW